MTVNPKKPEGIAFGRFKILPNQRELLADDVPIKLGGRAFDMLMALIEAPGVLVTKDSLMARVWPDRVVDENNLQTQILALRRAFGAERDLIRTVAGRGYQFTGTLCIVSSVSASRGIVESPPADHSGPIPTNLPRPVSELIGRDAEVREISGLVVAGRLVTLTGVGGIGKTRLALEVARQLLPRFPDGVWLAELSPLSDPSLVPTTVAVAVGLEPGGGEVSAGRVAGALVTRRLLLVLDTCEHVIDAAAAMAEAVLRAAPEIHVVATSREPLRGEGEQLYPVAPLAAPVADAEDPSGYGAVRLFVERAQASQPHFALDPRSAATIAAICRRLDGIPLAIEMAAARLAALGVDELARRLDDRLQLLTGGRRTSLPRHQTLRATLDWSHDLLAEPERVLLRRLSIFTPGFGLEAIGAVAADTETTAVDILDGLASLAAKSLVVTEIAAGVALYRLLDTTRAYAREKLAESGEQETIARRHAEYYRALFERAEAELEVHSTSDWLGEYGRQIDNLRAALDWAFSPAGDEEISTALTVAAIPLWIQSSSLEECRGRVERALAVLGGIDDPDARREMKLQAALGMVLIFASNATIPAIGAAWTRVLEIADRLDDAEYQLRGLLGLWFFNRASGRLRVALTLAQRFLALAASHSNSNDRLVGGRIIGVLLHFLGDQPSARRHLEHTLAHYVVPVRQSPIIRFQIDQRVTAGTFLGRNLWLLGFPDLASRVTEQCVNDARASGHVASLCYVVAQAACPIALWNGNLEMADQYAGMLIDLSIRYSLMRWHSFGRSHQGLIAIKRGDTTTGLQMLRSGLDELGETSAAHRLFLFQGEVAAALGRVGQIDEGLAALEEAIERADETEERWSISELLRIKGELLLARNAPDAAATAEEHFCQALDWAHRQGALSWELRAATSRARQLHDQGRSADGAALLRPIYERFTEGFTTADLMAANALLGWLC